MTSAPVDRMRGRSLAQVGRRDTVEVRREDDAASAPEAHDVRGERRSGLDVDEFSTRRKSRFEHLTPFLLAPLEEPALPGCATGDDDRSPAAFDGSRAIGTLEVIQPELDKVRPVGGIALPTQVLDGLGRHRDAHERFAHAENRKAPSARC